MTSKINSGMLMRVNPTSYGWPNQFRLTDIPAPEIIMKNSVIAIMLLLTLSGCESNSYRAHPDIEEKIRYIRNPALIVPDVQVVSVSAGGVRELRDDWVAIGRDNITAALQSEFNQKKCRTKTYLHREDLQTEMEEIKALYRAVATSISLHVFGPVGFPDKQKNFNW